MSDIGFNRRLHDRFQTKTVVRITSKGIRGKLCRAINLSASGAGIETHGMGLNKNQRIELTFIINLGTVQRLHKRMATVCHVTKGITGVVMGRYGDKI